MKSAVLSRLIMFTLVCAGAGYIVVANTTPATSVAAISRPDFSSAIVQTPLASQPLQHTVEVNLPPAQVNALAKANQPHAKFDDAAPHGPHDDLLALLATPEVEVSRPRSPFLERLPRLYEAKPVAKSAPPQSNCPRVSADQGESQKGSSSPQHQPICEHVATEIPRIWRRQSVPPIESKHVWFTRIQAPHCNRKLLNSLRAQRIANSGARKQGRLIW